MSSTSVVTSRKTTVEKVSRVNLLTREEIEAMEVQEFLKDYNINFTNSISQISENSNKITTIQVTDRKGK